MRFHIDPTFKFHIRCALLIAMTTAFAVLFGALVWSTERIDELAVSQQGFEAEARLLQVQLTSKLARVNAESASDVAQIEEQLRQIDARQNAGDQLARSAATKAPFAIGDVLGSVVELICIDNKDTQIYYTGSGTVIDPTGLIITNRHVLVSDDQSIIRYCGVGFTNDLHLAPKIQYVGTTVAVDADDDLALLKITDQLDGSPLPKGFPAISLTGAKDASLALNIGDPIFIAGYPGIGAQTFTFTQGVVSGRVGQNLIKTSALIDSGASGGAAFDADGDYVGVPTAAAKGEIGGSLGYLIGANVVAAFMTDYAKGAEALPALPVKKAR
jgi:S1-C subfamily serine protease